MVIHFTTYITIFSVIINGNWMTSSRIYQFQYTEYESKSVHVIYSLPNPTLNHIHNYFENAYQTSLPI